MTDRPPVPLTRKETKEATKEAIKEWLDEKFVALGKWSFGTLAAMLLAALTYFLLWSNGWHNANH